ncbi:hypothetical protein [Mycolicibacterium mucogenicum]|uniref:hypothetical protein n=1 Tax=Mycolicibacterium mucogenicum TaxID=56689 RepID=UPI00076A00FD|nr:hypothetical protein [Mycolicibacterium mucogenicum]
MNWSACATISSSTSTSQCRLAEYGHWIDTCMPALAGLSRTAEASNISPGSKLGVAELSWVSVSRYVISVPRDTPSIRAR